MQKRNHPSRPIIIAHRGSSADAPENTLAAFQKAIDSGAQYVELDVRLSKDRIPIVFHDPTLSRITGVKHAPSIDELPLSELKLIDAGKKFGAEFAGEMIPTLEDVLRLHWKDTGLMIEIKACPQPANEVVGEVFKILNHIKPLPHPLVIGSFSTDIYDAAQEQMEQLKPKAKIIGIIEKKEMIMPFVNRGVGMVAVWHKIITADLMTFLKARKIDVWSFTVDDPKKADSLIALGVKGIITNKIMNYDQAERGV